MRKSFTPLLIGLLLILPVSGFADETSVNTAEYQTWVKEMKAAERGPFSRIRWFCNEKSGKKRGHPQLRKKLKPNMQNFLRN
jgi:hypothetical protein